MGEIARKQKQMRVWCKIKLAKCKLLSHKAHKQAQKLALAVLITEYLIAGGWYYAEKQGILDYFQPKTVVIQVAEAKEIETKKPETNRIDELCNMIWNLESTRGQHNYSKCTAQGKVNGIGYGISGNGKYICFNSHEEEMQVLKGWIIDKQVKGMSEQELLCLYSGGNYKVCNK